MTDKDLAQAPAAIQRQETGPMPGTWFVDLMEDDQGFTVSTDQGQIVCRVYNSSDFPCVEEGTEDDVDNEARATAALIVKAVNERQQLVEALRFYAHELCEGWCAEAGGTFDDCGGCKARAALTATEA